MTAFLIRNFLLMMVAIKRLFSICSDGHQVRYIGPFNSHQQEPLVVHLYCHNGLSCYRAFIGIPLYYRHPQRLLSLARWLATALCRTKFYFNIHGFWNSPRHVPLYICCTGYTAQGRWTCCLLYSWPYWYQHLAADQHVLGKKTNFYKHLIISAYKCGFMIGTFPNFKIRFSLYPTIYCYFLFEWIVW